MLLIILSGTRCRCLVWLDVIPDHVQILHLRMRSSKICFDFQVSQCSDSAKRRSAYVCLETDVLLLHIKGVFINLNAGMDFSARSNLCLRMFYKWGPKSPNLCLRMFYKWGPKSPNLCLRMFYKWGPKSPNLCLRMFYKWGPKSPNLCLRMFYKWGPKSPNLCLRMFYKWGPKSLNWQHCNTALQHRSLQIEKIMLN